MLDDGLGLLPTYAAAIKALPAEGFKFSNVALFSILNEPPIQICYAPFDWINERAHVVICGITPGFDSMQKAIMAAKDSLAFGGTLLEASERGKRTGSFSQMRRNLVEMLDVLEVHSALGIATTASIFDGARRDLLHTTSCVRYPVFINGKNYTGHNPPLMRTSTFVAYIEDVLAAELRKLPGALIVPCGDAVDAALGHLVRRGDVQEDHCLIGFPHASGANGHRKRFFDARKDSLREKVKSWRRVL